MTNEYYISMLEDKTTQIINEQKKYQALKIKYKKLKKIAKDIAFSLEDYDEFDNALQTYNEFKK